MMKWLLLLGIVSVVSWWLSRPASADKPPRKNIKMQQCPHCKVYSADDSPCPCQQK